RRAVQPIAVRLQPKDHEPRSFGLHYVEDDVQPAFGVVEIERAHDDVERGVALEIDDDTRMLRDAPVAASDEDDLERSRRRLAGRDVNADPVASERAVQERERMRA